MTGKLTRHPTIPEFEPGHGFTKEDWDEVSDSPEATPEQLAQAKSFEEVFPEFAAKLKAMRGRPKVKNKMVAVTLRLSPETLATLKLRGKAWRQEAAQDLTRTAKRIKRKELLELSSASRERKEHG